MFIFHLRELCTSTYLADVELKDNFWKTDANVMDEILPKNSFISGNIVASAGYVCCSARRLFFTTGNKNATRLECIVESWNILPFMSVIPMQFYIGFWAFYKKNKVSGVRAIQAQREAVVTKRIFILAVFCFIIQALPLTVLLAIHKRSLSLHIGCVPQSNGMAGVRTLPATLS
ncbi:hypothetical protein T4A_1403 [Trichinella pseudospiralis]|uniref:Uncharacterized protein n=1 Tax=Trichinella pseudospiralis TaxID=6337 RepID=A0A0V1F014_TRIPS|nr:hypothetical protein T4A_1403 [Trichinella pseudospiralis]